VKTYRVLTGNLTDRQLVIGIQIRQLERVHAFAAILKKASAVFRNNGLRCFQLAESSAFRFSAFRFPATLAITLGLTPTTEY